MEKQLSRQTVIREIQASTSFHNEITGIELFSLPLTLNSWKYRFSTGINGSQEIRYQVMKYSDFSEMGNKQCESCNCSVLVPRDTWGLGIDLWAPWHRAEHVGKSQCIQSTGQSNREGKVCRGRTPEICRGSSSRRQSCSDQHKFVRNWQRLASEPPGRIRGNSVWHSKKAWSSLFPPTRVQDPAN